jgi:hypothetical protein
MMAWEKDMKGRGGLGQLMSILTFKWQSLYLNFRVWFMKNVNIIRTERDKIMT